jgi:hypothetical protein
MRTRSLIAAVLGALLLTLTGVARAHQSALMPSAEAGTGVLLGSSDSIARQVEAKKRREVLRQLADVHVGTQGRILSAQDLEILLDGDANTSDVDRGLDTVEVEARVFQGIREQPSQTTVPFGAAGIVWAVRHPSQAWRLMVPVLG